MSSTEIERFSEHLGNPYLAHEHAHRYWWALQFVKGKRVLDIACGTGYGCAILATAAEQVTGLDISVEAIERAQRLYARPNVHYSPGDCSTFSLPEPVDVIISFETIEHLDESSQKAFLIAVKRALRPGGLFIVSTPDKAQSQGPENRFHHRELTKLEFIDLLREHFAHYQMYGQRLFPGSWVAPLRDGNIDFGGELHAMAVDHSRGVTLLHEPTAPPPVYLLCICSDEPLMSGSLSLLLDSSYALNVCNAFETRLRGQETILASLPERISYLESQGLSLTSQMAQSFTGMEDRVARLEVELLRQIERISSILHEDRLAAVSKALEGIFKLLGEEPLQRNIENGALDDDASSSSITSAPADPPLLERVRMLEVEMMRQIERVTNMNTTGMKGVE